MRQLREFLLLLYCYSINFDAWSVIEAADFSVPKLIAIAYFGVVLLFTGINLSLGPYSGPFIAVCTTFLVISVSSIAHWNSIADNIIDTSFFLNILLFGSLLLHVRRTPEALVRGLIAYALGAVTLSLLLMAGIGREISVDGRASLFGDNENELGLRGAEAFIIFLALFVEGQKLPSWLRLAFGLLTLPCLTLMFATGSRVAFLAAALGFFVTAFAFQSRRVFLKVAFAAGVLVSLPYLAEYVQSQDVLFRRLLRTFESGDLARREQIWAWLLPYFWDSPLIGYGTAGYQLLTTKRLGYSSYLSPHNVLIEVLMLGGLFAILPYFFFLYRTTAAALLSWKAKISTLPLALCAPIAGILLSAQALDVKSFYLLAAYVLASPFQHHSSQIGRIPEFPSGAALHPKFKHANYAPEHRQ
jgi:O-antigen ligase